MPDHVRVQGLDDLRRELRKAGAGLGSLKEANREVSELVVEGALQRAVRLGGVHAHVARVGSIRASSKASASVVSIGGSGDKHGPALGAEFGSYQYRQFPAWRGSGSDAGYMVYPTIRAERDRIVEQYGKLIDSVMSGAFPDR